MRGISYALDVIEQAEKAARNLALKVEGVLGRESPIATDLQAFATRLNMAADNVKEDMSLQASVDRSPEGEKPQALSAKHESAVGEAETPQGGSHA